MTSATPRPATIEVVELVAVSKGNLKAFASVRIGPSLVVHKCRIVEQPGQQAWVSMPQERWEGNDGKPHYTALVEVTGDLRARVEAAILQEARRQGVISA